MEDHCASNFALDAVGGGINATDSSGQTALHRALEAGDEAGALDILANPEFKSVNMQEHSVEGGLQIVLCSGLWWNGCAVYEMDIAI